MKVSQTSLEPCLSLRGLQSCFCLCCFTAIMILTASEHSSHWDPPETLASMWLPLLDWVLPTKHMSMSDRAECMCLGCMWRCLCFGRDTAQTGTQSLWHTRLVWGTGPTFLTGSSMTTVPTVDFLYICGKLKAPKGKYYCQLQPCMLLELIQSAISIWLSHPPMKTI